MRPNLRPNYSQNAVESEAEFAVECTAVVLAKYGSHVQFVSTYSHTLKSCDRSFLAFWLFAIFNIGNVKVDFFVDFHDIVFQVRTSSGHHNFDTQMFG